MFDEFLERINSRIRSKIQRQTFLLVCGGNVSARPVGHQHGIFITQSSKNLGKSFPQISCIWKIALTWILASILAYLHPFISQILVYSTVWSIERFCLFYFIFFFDGVTVKNSNLVFDRRSTINLPWIIKKQLNFRVDLVFFHFLDINPHSHTNNLSLNTGC